MTGAKEKLGVARLRGEFRAVATAPAAPGEVIAVFRGVLADRPSRYSIQLGEHEHLMAPGDPDLEELLDHYPWRFLNHSCDPNAAVRERQLVAVRAIAALEEVSFDYNTTEYDLAAPFACRCSMPSCTGREIRGFKHLSGPERERLRPLLAPHLLRRLHDRTEST